MSVNYFVCGLGYYGVSQFISKMSGNIHANFAISGALLIMGTSASVFLLKILSRRTFLISTNVLSGVFMILVVVTPLTLSWLRVLFACLCNTFFFMSFIIIFLYSVELFPTAIRNSTLGVLSVLSRLGQITGPPINVLPQIYAGSIFGVLAIIAAALCYPLLETKGTELPSSLEETVALPTNRVVIEEETNNYAETTSSNNN